MPVIPIAMAAVAIGGAIMGGNAQKKAAKQAAEAQLAAIARAEEIINAVGAPPDLSQRIVLEQLKSAGVLTPELEQNIKVGTSKVSEIGEDAAIRDTQVKALKEMSKRGRAGLTAEERAEANVSRQGVQRDLQAKQEQIINDLAMRGQAGGGAEIAARLLSSQSAADRASEEADRIQATASQRALEAIGRESEMSGNLRNQDFNIAQTKAASEDEFNRFNVQNQIATQQRNVASKNVGQEYNLSNAQRIQDTNTQDENKERYRQSQAQRDFWQDKMQVAGAKVGLALGAGQAGAQQAQAMGAANAGMISGIAGGVGSAFGGLANYYGSKPAVGSTTGTAADRNALGR